eukprot:UN05948
MTFSSRTFPCSGLIKAYLDNIGKKAAEQLINKTFPDQDTTLAHRAAWNGDVDLLKLLVDYGSVTNMVNLYNETPMEVASTAFWNKRINDATQRKIVDYFRK